MTAFSANSILANRPPLDERINAFDQFRMSHPKLKKLQEEVERELTFCPNNSILLVFGPSGVGKSTLRETIERNLVKRMSLSLAQDQDRFPLISIEAQAPENGVFNWKQHFVNLLEITGEPLIELRNDRREIRFASQETRHKLALADRRTAPAYQTSVENAILGRRPAAVFIDEAQHICKKGSGRGLIDQLDVIKSIANRTKTPHVLVGTYDLLSFRHLTGQVARRCLEFHLERYRADDLDEARQFQTVIRTFASKMPFQECPDLTPSWEYLYERSLGCVGVLKDWLTRAVGLALSRNAKTLELKDLVAEQKSLGEISKLLSECRFGEEQLKENESTKELIRREMGLDKPVAIGSAPRSSPSGVKFKNGKRVPFTRKPKRDRVGRGEDGAGGSNL